MSLAKITEVKAARKDQGQCERCKTPLPAGSAYRWYTVGFRSSYKHVRCTDPACTPSRAELESSKLAQVWDAQDSFDVSTATTIEEIEQAVHDVGDQIAEVAQEYHDAAEDANGNIFNEEANERGDTLESSADELTDWSYDEEFTPCEAHVEAVENADTGTEFEVTDEGPQYDCEDCSTVWDTFIDDARDAAQEVVNGIETP